MLLWKYVFIAVFPPIRHVFLKVVELKNLYLAVEHHLKNSGH